MHSGRNPISTQDLQSWLGSQLTLILQQGLRPKLCQQVWEINLVGVWAPSSQNMKNCYYAIAFQEERASVKSVRQILLNPTNTLNLFLLLNSKVLYCSGVKGESLSSKY